MERHFVSQFDSNTFIVIDKKEQREICVCCNFDENIDAESRAQEIPALLNLNNSKPVKP